MVKQKQLLTKLVSLHISDTKEFSSKVTQFQRAINSEEWKFMRDTLIVIKSEMMTELLSLKYTNLPETEKDIIQRTYYQINELADFLLQPLTWLKSKRRFSPKEVLKKVKPTLTSKGKKNAR